MGAMAIIFKCILSLCMILHFVDGKTLYFVIFFSKKKKKISEKFNAVFFSSKNKTKTCDDMTVYIFPAECQ